MKRTKKKARSSPRSSTKRITSTQSKKNKSAATVERKSTTDRGRAENDAAGSGSAVKVGREPYVSIGEQDVILLQTTNHLGMSGLQDLVFWRWSERWGARFTS